MKNAFAPSFGIARRFWVWTLTGLLWSVSAPAAVVTLATNTFLGPADTFYDGQDIIVRNCTLTVNGSHVFNSMLLTNTGVLNHSAATNGEVSKQLNLTITQDLIVDGSSRIDARGLGYASATGPGAGGSFPTSTGSGAGHCGLGGVGTAGAASGWVYDAALAPGMPGSGGGNGYFSNGGAGGGVIMLTVNGLLWLSGSAIWADGASGSGGPWAGGGSGGSIAITAGQLGGFGQISANGGAASSGGGGGGGAISINCISNFFAGAITAYGGAGNQFGGAGTVFIKTAILTIGELRIDNGGASGQHTPLAPLLPVNLTIANQAVVYPQTTLTNANLIIKSNGVLTHVSGQSGLLLTVLTNLTIQPGGQLDVSGKGYPAALGPGAGSSVALGGGGGGGHGGSGGGASAVGGGSYDSIVAPVQWGSGGGNGYAAVGGTGGGAAALTVGNTLRIDGVLKSEGTYGYGSTYGGGGAGGSLYLAVGTLTGGGLISANGGDSFSNGGGGAGGRIAIFFSSNSFSGALSAYGGSGASRGGAGTIYTKPGGAARGMTLIHNGGNTGGLTRLNREFWPAGLYFDLTVAGAAVMTPDSPLTFGDFVVTSGATVGPDSKQALQIVALNDLRIDAGAFVSANGLGYASMAGPGAGQGSGGYGGGGGGYGGMGGAVTNGGAGGGTYGSAAQPLDFGSGGGAGYFSTGGTGGGVIRLSAGRIFQVNGTIMANGIGSPDYLYGGGGSGGSIFLIAGILSGTGAITANGGDSSHGGGGGGGRIGMYGGIEVNLPNLPSAAGGLSGDGSVSNRNGRAGTVLSSTNMPPFQVVSIAPAGFVTPPINNIDVTFNMGVNSNTFPIANVVLTTPAGIVPQNQISLVPLGGPVFRLTFPTQTAVGQYTLQLGPHIQDFYAREMDQNGNGTGGENPGDLYSASFSLGTPATISGTVRLGSGVTVSNVLIQAGTNTSAMSDSAGNYTLYLPQGWTGSVTASKLGCMLSPGSRPYVGLSGDVSEQNYTLTPTFAPSLQALMLGASFRVEWSSLVGIQYQLQTSTDLFFWANAGQPIYGTGGTLSWVFDASGKSIQFIRIIANN